MWAGEVSKGWIGKDCEVGKVVVRTLAFIWNDMDSQFGTDKWLDET